MSDEDKSKEQLVSELVELRQRVAELQESETKRKQAEEALRESEEKYRTLVETANEAIFVVDYDGVFLFMNSVAARQLGGQPEDFVGKTMWDVFDGEVAERQLRGVREMIESGQGRIRESETVLQGERRWYRTNGQPIKDRSGNYYAVLLIGTDITDRKRAEAEVRQRTAQLEALREVGLELTAQLDRDTLLYSITSRAIELLGESEGGLYLYRPEQDVLQWVVAIGPNMAPVGTVLQRGEGLSGKVLESGKPLIVDDYQHWEGHAAVYEGYPFTAVMGVPIRWGEEFLGVLDVLADSPRTFSPADVELLSLFATQAAVAIRNARLMHSLQGSEARYRAIVEDQTELICRFQPDGTLTFVNEAYCRYFDKKREELIGHSFMPLIPEEDQRSVEEQFTFLSPESPVVTYEHRTILPDGQIHWQRWTDRAIFDEQGRIVEFQSVGQDITGRKQAEEEREKLVLELQDALAEIKTLRGIVPICSSCKKIRDDEGYWQHLEIYIRDHTEAEFSHGLCPECAKKLYPDFFRE